MRVIKFIVLALLISIANQKLSAQVIDEVNGKTYYYYDSLTHKKVKEIYHHIQEIKIFTDNHGNSTDTLITIKNGPYTRYYESGQLECSGYYDHGKKNGTWKYYTQKGTMIRTEQWNQDKLVKSDKG